MSDSRTSLADMPASRRTLITAVVMLGTVMQLLDTTIANVALPRIQGSLSATQDQITWVLTSYIVASAVMIPLTGWLAVRFGRKGVYLSSIVGFTVASMLCGISQTLPQIVIARLLQGAFGAALVPTSQSVLLDINPPERHARAMAVWVTGVSVAPIVAPVFGGWLTDNYDWRWVFYINVPLGVVAYFGSLAIVPDSKTKQSPFDFFGFLTLSLAIAALQIFLDRGQLKDWFNSSEIWVEAAICAAAFYLFTVHMFTSRKTRFLEPALFKDRNFIAANVIVFVMAITMFAALALLPTFLQDLLNYPVVTTGIVMAPRGIGLFFSTFIVARLLKFIDARYIVALGLALTALSGWQMSRFDLQMDQAVVMWSGIAQGCGTSAVFVPLAGIAFATLAPSLRNEGASLFSLSRNVGSSVGISIVETLLTRNTQVVHASLAEHVTPYSAILRTQMAKGMPSAQGLSALNARVTEQATMIAYIDNFHMMMYLTLAAIPLVLLFRKANSLVSPPHVVVE